MDIFSFPSFTNIQKNPSTIRQPEEDRGKENFTMTAWVDLERSSPISRHMSSLCLEAKDSTYVRIVDLKSWAELPGKFNAFSCISGNISFKWKCKL